MKTSVNEKDRKEKVAQGWRNISTLRALSLAPICSRRRPHQCRNHIDVLGSTHLSCAQALVKPGYRSQGLFPSSIVPRADPSTLNQIKNNYFSSLFDLPCQGLLHGLWIRAFV